MHRITLYNDSYSCSNLVTAGGTWEDNCYNPGNLIGSTTKSKTFFFLKTMYLCSFAQALLFFDLYLVISFWFTHIQKDIVYGHCISHLPSFFLNISTSSDTKVRLFIIIWPGTDHGESSARRIRHR